MSKVFLESKPADGDELAAISAEAEEAWRETIRKLKEQPGDLLERDEDILSENPGQTASELAERQ